ncbi:MAG: hypothetical protein Q8J78_16885 [Moraxellaceae bacterium]|nr:hypothetical protein [Moraxellaceae bacterium]
MNTLRTLAPRLALATGIALVTASLYAHVGERQAESRAVSFCAAATPGESASTILGRVRSLADEAQAVASQNGVSVVWGSDSQYACDIRFEAGQVVVAAVTPLD